MQVRSLKPLLFPLLLFLSLPAGCAWAQSAAPASGMDAESLVKEGVATAVTGDLNGAISAFNQAIKIDPKFAPAYERRGFAFSLQNKLDDAITDYNHAIQLDPKYLDAYYYRGLAGGQKGDFDRAIADFTRVLELRPQSPLAYYNRGHCKYFTGDFDGATSDLNQTISTLPKYPFAYYIRGLVRRAQGNETGAALDFQTSADDGFYSGAFWLWIVHMDDSEQGIAHQTLSTYAGQPGFFKNDDFAPQIANFLLGKITQDQLMAAAQAIGATKDRLAVFWYYAGMSRFFSGDFKGAQDCFQKSIATQLKGSEEVTEAQRQLAKLQATGL